MNGVGLLRVAVPVFGVVPGVVPGVVVPGVWGSGTMVRSLVCTRGMGPGAQYSLVLPCFFRDFSDFCTFREFQ